MAQVGFLLVYKQSYSLGGFDCLRLSAVVRQVVRQWSDHLVNNSLTVWFIINTPVRTSLFLFNEVHWRVLGTLLTPFVVKREERLDILT